MSSRLTLWTLLVLSCATPAAAQLASQTALVGTVTDSGNLVLHTDDDVEDPIPAFASDCLGGTGEECTGGTRIFSTVNPGISPLEESEPEESAFTLVDETPVTFEVWNPVRVTVIS